MSIKVHLVRSMCQTMSATAIEWDRSGKAKDAFGNIANSNADVIREMDDDTLTEMFLFAQIGWCHVINTEGGAA